MTRAGRRLAGSAVAALAVAAGLATARAYNDDPTAERVFPAWLPVVTVAPDRDFSAALVWYEVRTAGHHTAEIHFRNIAGSAWSFDWWIPGWQRPGDNARAVLRPFFETKEELKVRVPLRHGRPGIASSRMRVFDLRREDEVSPPTRSRLADAPGAADAAPPMPEEDWMPVRPLTGDDVVRRMQLFTRFREGASGAAVEFRNLSPQDLHFRFEIPALGLGIEKHGRVSVPARSDVSVETQVPAAGRPLCLARVVVCDVRVGADKGPLFAEDRRADAGWYPLATADDSAELPHERMFAIVEPLEGRRARVRFRSRLRTPVEFRFSIPGYQTVSQDTGEQTGRVTVEPASEAEFSVPLDRAADARLAIARVRVWDVSHRDGE